MSESEPTGGGAAASSPPASLDPRGSAFWQNRYETGGDGWELGRPAPPLEALFRGEGPVVAKTALVPGCGRGNEVLLLAELGYQVTGVDLAPAAIDALRRAATERGHAERVTAVLGDALCHHGPVATAAYDLWVEHTCFCAIDPEQRSAYVQTAARALVPGGRLVGLIWSCGAEAGPPFHTDPGAFTAMLADTFDIEQFAPAVGSVESRAGEWLVVARRRVAK